MEFRGGCAGSPAADTTAGDQELAGLLAALDRAEAAMAEAVAAAGRVAGSGAAEREHGLPLDLLLATRGLTGADRHMVITAGQVLDTMPRLAAAHAGGRVSWGVVRHVVTRVRRRSLEDRAVLDARVGATLDREAAAGVDVEPDELCAAVDGACDELASRRRLDERDRRAPRSNRLWVQHSLDGRVVGGFDYDPVTGAVVANAIADARGRPAGDGGPRAPEQPTAQQRSAAAALHAICDAWLAGGVDGPARAAYTATVAVDHLDARQPGRLRLRLPGASPRLSGRRVAADAARGADVRVVVTDAAGNPQAVTGIARTDDPRLDHQQAAALAAAAGVPAAQQAGLAALLAAVQTALTAARSDVARVLAGHRPLADPHLRSAATTPTATRVAVAARDLGCLFYGCAAPVDWCDAHHLLPRDHGGDHHPDNIAMVCRPDHVITHRHGWRLRWDPATATITGQRRTHTWRTRPRGWQLAPDPRPPPDTPGTDPPPPTDLPF